MFPGVGHNRAMRGTPSDRRRIAILAASFTSLAVLAVLAFVTAHIHVGALAVVPILFIAYYVRPAGALLTAFVTGTILGLLDQGERVAARHIVDLPPLMDALVLSIVLCAIVMVANRLRNASLANDLLRGSLVKARRAADHDALTGVPNRAYFLRSLSEAIARAGFAERIAILFCDLDRFKLVNDEYGHLVGDAVLKMAASRLSNTVRSVDVAARLGGDEFGIIARGVHDPDEAVQMAAQIERGFANPFQTEEHRHDIGITVGISLFPEDGTDPESLLRIADARMYRAKQAKHAARVTT